MTLAFIISAMSYRFKLQFSERDIKALYVFGIFNTTSYVNLIYSSFHKPMMCSIRQRVSRVSFSNNSFISIPHVSSSGGTVKNSDERPKGLIWSCKAYFICKRGLYARGMPTGARRVRKMQERLWLLMKPQLAFWQGRRSSQREFGKRLKGSLQSYVVLLYVPERRMRQQVKPFGPPPLMLWEARASVCKGVYACKSEVESQKILPLSTPYPFYEWLNFDNLRRQHDAASLSFKVSSA